MLSSRLIYNCPITLEAVTIANTYFCPYIAMLKGKITRKYSEPVVTDYVEIPQRMPYLNKSVIMEVYLMFLNDMELFSARLGE